MVPGSLTCANWLVKLQGLTFEVKYVEGDKNVFADLMSRPFDVVRCSFQAIHDDLRKEAESHIESNQSNSEVAQEKFELVNAIELGSVFDVIAGEQTSEVLDEYKVPQEKVVDMHDVYFYDDESGDPKLIVPPEHTKFLIDEVHNFGHFGPKKVIWTLRQFYWWPGLSKEVTSVLRACERCAKCKVSKRIKRQIVKFPTTYRFRTVHIDLVGPLPKPGNQPYYLLTMLDRFSRWIEAVVTTSIEAERVAKLFYENWICRFGIPDIVITDRGTQFESRIFHQMCDALDIKRRRTTAYNPKTNGAVERAHKTLKNMFRCYATKFRDWQEALPTVLFAMRTACSASTGYPPACLVYGEPINIPGTFVKRGNELIASTGDTFLAAFQQYWFKLRDHVLAQDVMNQVHENRPLGKYPHEYVYIENKMLKSSLRI